MYGERFLNDIYWFCLVFWVFLPQKNNILKQINLSLISYISNDIHLICLLLVKHQVIKSFLDPNDQGLDKYFSFILRMCLRCNHVIVCDIVSECICRNYLRIDRMP